MPSLDFPSSPINGQTYTFGSVTYIYVSATGTWDLETTVAPGPIYTEVTPPSSPDDGDLWYNSTNGNLYIYYQDGDSGQWVGTTTAVGPNNPSTSISSGIGLESVFMMMGA